VGEAEVEQLREGLAIRQQPAPPVQADERASGDGGSYTTTKVKGVHEPAADPVRIEIPAIGVDTAVDAVGKEASGAMEIPEDVRRVGWYSPGGVRPGDPGTAVIAGHVDSRTQGRGAFFDLGSLGVDDEVVVSDADGDETSWRVVARTSFDKDEIPLETIFARGAGRRLALITCGGRFDAAAGSYTDNVVVIAVPSEA